MIRWGHCQTVNLVDVWNWFWPMDLLSGLFVATLSAQPQDARPSVVSFEKHKRSAGKRKNHKDSSASMCLCFFVCMTSEKDAETVSPLLDGWWRWNSVSFTSMLVDSPWHPVRMGLKSIIAVAATIGTKKNLGTKNKLKHEQLKTCFF